MKGSGKSVYVYSPIKQEPELMAKMVDRILISVDDLMNWASEIAAACCLSQGGHDWTCRLNLPQGVPDA